MPQTREEKPPKPVGNAPAAEEEEEEASKGGASEEGAEDKPLLIVEAVKRPAREGPGGVEKEEVAVT